MKELLYTILELEEWNKETICDFCSGLKNKNNKAVCQIRTRSKINEELIANDCACENCKEKFENDEIVKCKECGRLQNESDMNILSGRYVCRCIRRKEDTQERELPALPHERRPNAFYERQINALREKERELVEEVDTHLEALEVSEVWNKRQKQELLDRIKELEAEVERLKKQTPQALVDEIENLKNQLEQQNSQIEVKETKKQYSWLRFRK